MKILWKIGICGYLLNASTWSQIKNNGFPASNFMFKVNSRSTRTRCEMSSKLTIKTSEVRHWRRFGAFIVNLEHISHLALVLLLLTLNSYMPAGLSLKLFKLLLKVYLTNFMPLLAFYIPWKHQLCFWCFHRVKKEISDMKYVNVMKAFMKYNKKSLQVLFVKENIL